MSLSKGTAPQFETVSKQSPFGALISRTLPAYHGEYPVGVCDVELPVPHETFGNFYHKSLGEEHGAAGLSLDTVLFSMFYPTIDAPTSKKVIWFPNPWTTIDGFLRMARRTPNLLHRAVAYPLAAAAIYGTTFPAKPNFPLLEPKEGKKWPVVIFSHGVGCSRLMYSTICGEIASRGYIVCAIEHRDGTSPSSRIMSEDGKFKMVDWLQWSDLYWPDREEDDQPEDDTILRHSQIEMRVTEMHHVMNAMQMISEGSNITRHSVHSPDFDWSTWHGTIDASKAILTGHSLGGSAAIAAAADPRFSPRHIVAYDPAVQRLEPWNAPINAPLYILNSEEFSKSSDHLRLSRLITFAERCIGVFSIAGSTHPSFSDVFLIIPTFIAKLTGLTAAPPHVVSHAVNSTVRFLEDDHESVLERTYCKVKRPQTLKALPRGSFVVNEMEGLEDSAPP